MHTGAALSSFASVCVSAPVFRSILWKRVTLVFCPSVKTVGSILRVRGVRRLENDLGHENGQEPKLLAVPHLHAPMP